MAASAKLWIAEEVVTVDNASNKPRSGRHYYNVTFHNIAIPVPGRVYLDLPRQADRRQTSEAPANVAVTFNGVPQAGLTDFELSPGPTGFQWTQAAPAAGALTVDFELCEEPITFLCVVSIISVPVNLLATAARDHSRDPNIPQQPVVAAPQAPANTKKGCCLIS